MDGYVQYKLSTEVVLNHLSKISSSDMLRYCSGTSDSVSECSADLNKIGIEQKDKGQLVITFWIIYKIQQTMISW